MTARPSGASRLLALLLPVLGLMAVPPLASADYVVRGAGFGHGVGMSQYGAYGFALKDTGYREILEHYYRGTTIGSAGGRTIRVLLRASEDGVTAFRGARRLGVRRLTAGTTYEARREGDTVEVRARGGRVVSLSSRPVRISRPGGSVQLLGGAMNGVQDGRYRGALELRPGLYGGVSVINPLQLDAYVQGVVPGEMPPSWHLEALKAQTLAARSYALATDAGGPIFDQYPDTRSQVYKGVSGEHPRTNAAVRDTRGEVVTHRGAVATTFFFSTSGGQTEDVENSFPGASPSPYLKSVRDPYDDVSPRHRWTLRFTQREMDSKLRGLVKGAFRGIDVTRRGSSPRIVTAVIRGSRGSTTVSGPTLRFRLGLHDTWAYFSEEAGSAAVGGLAGMPRPGRPATVAGASVPPMPR